MRTIAVGLLTNLDLALSHAPSVATLLPQKQVISRFYPFLCVTMIDAQKRLFLIGEMALLEGKCRRSSAGRATVS